MYLHEFQAKKILKENNILIPKSYLIKDINELNENIIKTLNCKKIVMKAQVHSGNRGENGGVIILNNNEELIKKNLIKMLNNYIKTSQTNEKGKKITSVLIEEMMNIEKELYLSIFLNRSNESITILLSKNGGTNVEKNKKSSFIEIKYDIFHGLQDFHIRNIEYFLNEPTIEKNKIKLLIENIINIFLKNDLLLLEINPLALINKNFYCIDAKIEVDDNAFFRQKDLFNSYDYEQDDDLEKKAKKLNLNYISLNGNIGCIVNGAGLAMATMDLLKINNGKPNNFLDIGGNATEETMLNAIDLIINDKNVKSILINIFGGIIRCDIIAENIIKSLDKLNINIPIIIRLEGNKSKEGLDYIKERSKNKIITENDLDTAIKKTIINTKIGN